MTALSESFTKLVSKISEAGRLGDKVLTSTESPCQPQNPSSSTSSPQQPARPGSPFILLLSEGEDEQVAHDIEADQQIEENNMADHFHLHAESSGGRMKNNSFGSECGSIDSNTDMERNLSFSINPSNGACVEIIPDQNE